jgi:hypothetical protein
MLASITEEEQVMAKHKVALLVLAFLIAASGLILLGELASKGSNGEAIAAGVPATEDARQIEATIWRAYELYEIAGRTYDVSEFPKVFADDPRVPLTRDQRERLEEWFGSVPEGAGYLTYVTACYTMVAQSDELFEEAWARARAEGRDHLLPQDYLTPEEWSEIQKSNRPIPPPPPAPPRGSVIIEEVAQWIRENTRFDSVVISDNKATVLFDDGATLNEATLLRSAGKWYIAGVERLAVTGP